MRGCPGLTTHLKSVDPQPCPPFDGMAESRIEHDENELAKPYFRSNPERIGASLTRLGTDLALETESPTKAANSPTRILAELMSILL